MADYKIAPDITGIISLGAMRKSLEAEADYNAALKHTAASTSVNTLVGTPSSYQTNCDSFTWSATSPKGFQEMYGETWSDGSGGGGPTSYTLTLSTPNNSGDNCDRAKVTIVQGGVTLATMQSDAGGAPSWNVSSVTVTDASVVRITGQDQGGGGAGCNTSYTNVTVRDGNTIKIKILDQVVVIGTSTTPSVSGYWQFTPSGNKTINVHTVAVEGL
jgi:hypothetical protein